MSELTPSRPEPIQRTKLLVWAAAAGRCTFCNRLVTENDDLGLEVPIGELAHNVGWSETSPRGVSEMDRDERREPENLLLLCRNCHKPTDDKGVIGSYTIERLTQFKRDHEERVRFLTEIGADRTAVALRVVGPIRDEKPHRPGLLDGPQLHELHEQRFAAASTIEHAEHTLQRTPRAPASRARNTAAEKTAAYRAAEDVLANHDRPLHRRKHTTEIAAARLDIERLPGAVRASDNELGVAVAQLERLRQEEAQARASLQQRHDFET